MNAKYGFNESLTCLNR